MKTSSLGVLLTVAAAPCSSGCPQCNFTLHLPPTAHFFPLLLPISTSRHLSDFRVSTRPLPLSLFLLGQYIVRNKTSRSFLFKRPASNNVDYINDVENLMRKYPDLINRTSSLPISNRPTMHKPSSSINFSHMPSPQQFQTQQCQIPTPTSSRQFRSPPSQFPAPSSQIPTPNYSQQFQGSQPPPTYTQKGKEKSSQSEGLSKLKWEREEDIALCEIGSNVSDRPKQQRYASFWKIIVTEYNERMKDHPNGYRDAKSCQNRWDRIKKVALGWRAAMERVRSENRSGFNELDNINLAKSYFDANPNNLEKFKHDHIIQHLESFSKYNWTTTEGSFKTFDDIEDFVATPSGSSQGSAKRTSPFLDEDSQENIEISSPAKKLQRPEGVKRQKANTKAARDIFEEKKIGMDLLAEARLLEAKAALVRAEMGTLKIHSKTKLKEKKMEMEYLSERYSRANIDEEREAFKILEKSFNEKWLK